MARYRRRKKGYKRYKGLMHDVSLYWKSSARRKGALLGMVLAPALMATTQFGAQAGKWVGDQVRNLTGQQG
tara:strand:+ start:776 stop:988 length:213 start_codon:yes stop_codon:yes gene_type:complete